MAEMLEPSDDYIKREENLKRLHVLLVRLIARNFGMMEARGQCAIHSGNRDPCDWSLTYFYFIDDVKILVIYGFPRCH